MNVSDQLDPLDRATLIVWRAGHFVKWCIAALAVAFAIAGAFLFSLPRLSFDGSTAGGAAGIAALTLAPTVLSAIAIGVIVGRHLPRRAVATAAVLAVVHLALSVMFALHGVHVAAPAGSFFAFAPVDNPAPAVLMAVTEIYAAAAIARRTASKRPAALRGA